MFIRKQKLDGMPGNLKLPRHGIVVATWTPYRNGWQYSDYTSDWREYSLGTCIRLFRKMVPYAGTQHMVLAQDGVIWAYQWLHTTRWQRRGASSSGRWVRELVKTTGYAVRRTRWLRMLGIHWRTI